VSFGVLKFGILDLSYTQEHRYHIMFVMPSIFLFGLYSCTIASVESERPKL